MSGLLGAATVNPLMARQFANARQNVTAPTSVMDERYPAWKKSQDQATQFLLAADLIGSAVPAGLLAAPAMKKGLLSMGETVAPKMENYMARQGLLQPITAYHGSPHRFDKFDAAHIGKGEGAQAYGHGIYFAESPTVAKSYASLSPAGGPQPSPRRFFNGSELEAGSPEYHAATLLSSGKSIPSVRKEVQNWINDAKNWSAQRLADPNEQRMLAGWQKTLETLNQAKSKAQFKTLDATGNLYTVDLPDPMIAKMLDWDKPLSQQPESIRNIANQLGFKKGKAYVESDGRWYKVMVNDGGKEYGQLGGDKWFRSKEEAELAMKKYIGPHGAGDPSGEEIYKTLLNNNGRVEASDALNSAGIPGIRYLDGGSRGTGAGTSNFVVFPGNEQLVKILSRE